MDRHKGAWNHREVDPDEYRPRVCPWKRQLVAIILAWLAVVVLIVGTFSLIGVVGK